MQKEDGNAIVGKQGNEGLAGEMHAAVDECIEKGILSDFLGTYKEEIVDTLVTEFNVERYIAKEKQASYEEGRKVGIYSCVTDAILPLEGAAKLLACTVEDVLGDMQQRGLSVPEQA